MNNFNPLVSIVIPVYNGANYLQCAIDSALGQDYGSIEVIVVNDGSTDNTEEIAKSYGDSIVYFSKENGGVSTALNLAIRNAKGEYISWLSHDDYYLPNKISRQIEVLSKLNNPEKIIIYSNVKIHHIRDGYEVDSGRTYIKNSDSHQLSTVESVSALLNWHIHGCSLLVPKNAFINVSYFNEALIVTQDYHLWFRLIKDGYQFYCFPEILLVTRMHNQQSSIQKSDAVRREQIKLWKFIKKEFRQEINIIKSNKRYLSDKQLKAFKSGRKKKTIFYPAILILKRLIPERIKQFIKFRLR